jgi:hypothetical protein
VVLNVPNVLQVNLSHMVVLDLAPVVLMVLILLQVLLDVLLVILVTMLMCMVCLLVCNVRQAQSLVHTRSLFAQVVLLVNIKVMLVNLLASLVMVDM